MSGTAWYVARAGGFTALVLLTAAVALGLALSLRAHSHRWPRFAIEEVHRFAGLLTGVFVVLHGAGLLLDSYLPFSLADLLVPGHGPYRPLASALGIVAAELLVALALTNRLRGRIGYRFWRRAHYLNFAVWWLAVLHGLLSGTDTGTPWGVGIYLACIATVALLVAARVLTPSRQPSGQQVPVARERREHRVDVVGRVVEMEGEAEVALAARRDHPVGSKR
jgi:methionine sulfoxide reductase heme-binding subunit